MIDDQPEVSIDDPQFLFESNEGFQEVMTKKQAKSKRSVVAAADAAQAKLQLQLASAVQQQVKLIKAKDLQSGGTKVPSAAQSARPFPCCLVNHVNFRTPFTKCGHLCTVHCSEAVVLLVDAAAERSVTDCCSVARPS